MLYFLFSVIIFIMQQLKIYLDNCAYNRPFDDQRQIRIFLEAQAKLYIQSLIISKRLALVCSYFSYYENNDNPHKERRLSIARFFGHASIVINYEKAEQVKEKAAEIMKYHKKNKDAKHIASAIEAECDYFITTDDDVIKCYTGNEITVCNLVDFIRILEEQDD